MCSIYAFMRYCDDLSDEPGANRVAMERWRAEMEDALEGRFSNIPCGRPFTTRSGASASRSSIFAT